ncbi:hypothetical protein A9Q96_05045 [Rhodobacterales bacterium 52_120_T64]|nr:hypothetical protein A9Q96_05045 [Rhodobacterales bacterium 52_120_T64]
MVDEDVQHLSEVRYPDITIELKLSDRFANIVEEGFDLAIRAGALKDSSLIARKLASSHIVYCATPEYLREHGRPQHPDDLTDHSCIVDSNFEGRTLWPFMENGEKITVAVQGPITVNSAIACRKLALRGFGIMQTPYYMVAKEIAANRLIPILQNFDVFNSGLYAVYPHSKHLPIKNRVFVGFLVGHFAKTDIEFG